MPSMLPSTPPFLDAPLRTRARGVLGAAAALVLAACASADRAAEAQALAHDTIILDGHVDLPFRLSRRPADVTQRTEDGDFDYVRAREGGLDAPFMSIFVPASYEEQGGARAFADELIDLVEGLAAEAPTKFAMASSAADVRAIFESGRIALLLGMENGAPIEGRLENADHFHARGVRYITLCHSKDNHICDSSYDTRHSSGGLTPFGFELVRRMNELGILIDVSHVSDDSFWQVMETTAAPVIASHSSLRHFVPGFERNMSDDMVRRMAANGGVVQINFGSTFISSAANGAGDARRAALLAHADEHDLERGDPALEAFSQQYAEQHPFPRATVADVVDHIDRVVDLAGIDHVGLGSDFDGVGDSLPEGLRDVSMYPNLIEELLGRGYSHADIVKICSGNVLRVLAAAERNAAGLSAGTATSR